MAVGGSTTPLAIRVGRGARVQPVPLVRTSTNNGKEDDVVAGGQRPATDKGAGEHTIMELGGGGGGAWE